MLAKEQLSAFTTHSVAQFGLTASVVATSMLMLQFIAKLRLQASPSTARSGNVKIVALMMSVASPFTLWLVPGVIEAVALTFDTHSKALLLTLLAIAGYMLFNRWSNPDVLDLQGLKALAQHKVSFLKLPAFTLPSFSIPRLLSKLTWRVISIRFEYGLILFLSGMLLLLILNLMLP
ncbi:hypothetical protein HHX48_04230 [Salinimonas sp. HHU 13199]|uniref:DUF1772 domain-containing protein n=1 Tax=Salinimonas profundi TaxID=2729140 RepID=A0ABR8LLJ5_9ALTE|nr:hypothetical protein [Salinimonas profundi]MBD3584944.1 hypothetical protein [Salinimonas profundi]